jgi:DNA-binding MarR family transcriptional regulator
VFFGVEIILREFFVDALFTVMLAAMTADITAIPFLGDRPFLSGFPSGIGLHQARNYLLIAVLAVAALVVLAAHGPQGTAELAAELGVNPSTVTRMCDRLVRKGLARRSRVAGDRRAVRIALTAPGRDLVAEVTAWHVRAGRAGGVTPAERVSAALKRVRQRDL